MLEFYCLSERFLITQPSDAGMLNGVIGASARQMVQADETVLRKPVSPPAVEELWRRGPRWYATEIAHGRRTVALECSALESSLSVEITSSGPAAACNLHRRGLIEIRLFHRRENVAAMGKCCPASGPLKRATAIAGGRSGLAHRAA